MSKRGVSEIPSHVWQYAVNHVLQNKHRSGIQAAVIDSLKKQGYEVSAAALSRRVAKAMRGEIFDHGGGRPMKAKRLEETAKVIDSTVASLLNDANEQPELQLEFNFEIENENENEIDREDYNSSLHIAVCNNGSKEQIEQLIEAKIDVNARDEFGCLALHYVACDGNLDVATLLIEKGSDINAKNNNMRSCVHQAAFYGQDAMVQLLIEHNANVDAVDQAGNSSLHVAVKNHHHDVAKMLISMKADVNQCNKISNDTPLHCAIWSEDRTSVAILLQHNAIPDAKDKNGRSPLHVAVQAQQIFNLLLQTKANVDDQDKNGDSILHSACAETSVPTSIIECLLSNTANPNIVNNNMETPLFAAAKRNQNDKIRCLLKAGCDASRLNKFHQTAAFFASNEVTRELLSN